MNSAISTNNLAKRYDDVTAVDGLSLRVARGEIYAFLGLNGAGKTTTIRMLLGMVKPTAGEARVLGTRIRVGGAKPWEAVGYLVETADAYPELSVRENLEAVRRLRPGVPPKAVDTAIERLGLVAYADRRAGTLSHGNAQRLGLAKALLHTPELLILDEPANGLDPAGIFMVILKDPEFARRVGLISAKAQLVAGVADWSTYLDLLAQATAIGGLILFSLVGSWVFGREYSDRTVKDLLALPTSRSAIVAAKFTVIAAWSAVLVAIVYLIGLSVGALVGLPGGSTQLIFQGGGTIAITAGLTVASVTPIIFFASAGHGYLPPMGVAILAIFLAQIVAVAGWGEYFPWSIPALYSQGENLGMISYLVIILAGVAGIGGTFIWWELADQAR